MNNDFQDVTGKVPTGVLIKAQHMLSRPQGLPHFSDTQGEPELLDPYDGSDNGAGDPAPEEYATQLRDEYGKDADEAIAYMGLK